MCEGVRYTHNPVLAWGFARQARGAIVRAAGDVKINLRCAADHLPPPALPLLHAEVHQLDGEAVSTAYRTFSFRTTVEIAPHR